MFVTSDPIVFQQYTLKNATLIKTAGNGIDEDTAKRMNNTTQILLNILVQGKHRSRRNYTRPSEGQNISTIPDNTVSAEEEDELNMIMDEHESIEGLANELARALGESDHSTDNISISDVNNIVEEETFYFFVTKAMDVLESEELLTFSQLRSALYAITKTEKSRIKNQDVVDILRERYKEKIAQTREMFKDARDRLRSYFKNHQGLLANGMAATEIATRINEQASIMDRLIPNSGQDFVEKMREPDFTDTTNDVLVKLDMRCADCRVNNRFPMTLITYDEETSRVKVDHPSLCKCFESASITKLIFMPDVIEKFAETTRHERHAALFLFSIEELFIQRKDCNIFKLQFIYLLPEHYELLYFHLLSSETTIPLPDAIPVKIDGSDDRYENQDNPSQAADVKDVAESAPQSGYLEKFMSYLGVLQLGTKSGEKRMKSSILSLGRTVDGGTQPAQKGVVVLKDGRVIKRSQNRKDILYKPLQEALDKYMRTTFDLVHIHSELTFRTISGNERQRLAIDATIDLYKTQPLKQFIIISPRDATELINMMNKEIRLIGSKEKPQILESAKLADTSRGASIIRLIISADADELGSQHLLRVDLVAFKFGILFQQLDLDGMAVIMNHSLSNSDIKKFSAYYSYEGDAKIKLTVINSPIGDLIFFYSSDHTTHDLNAIYTEIYGNLGVQYLPNHRRRIIQFGQQVQVPLVASTPPEQETPTPLLSDLMPVSNEERAAAAKAFQEGNQFPLLDLEPALPASVELPLSLPSPLIGSRLWRSGTQLALMLRS